MSIELSDGLWKIISDYRMIFFTKQVQELKKENKNLKNCISKHFKKCELCDKYRDDICEFNCNYMFIVCKNCLKTSDRTLNCSICRRSFICNCEYSSQCYDYCEYCDKLYCFSCGTTLLCGKCNMNMGDC